jgi:hypothetical protein
VLRPPRKPIEPVERGVDNAAHPSPPLRANGQPTL